ncbi:hydroxymethylbilane synthase [Qipengyuania sp. 1NDH17]|uniref:Porphobilinogen deaminase n=1 Tax=Qipengyuania polymorpha TaxID=2867234 RepID=A0ABS7IWJ3_9SPHN|nr:hydroxymethylbilane synthase [Qipengyuania polymorpha]MBX7457907.1 hydroxymethylbilane synthase [Qipengyuania polymorpha]
MPETPPFRLGTRRSPLAMAQAHEARARLCAALGWDEAQVELVPVVASGDKIQDRPLADIGGKALWTRELDIWLAEGKIDAAVHSMKDVETIRPAEIVIAAILPRADKADVLLGATSLSAIPQGARVGTSAPRRAAQLLNARPDLEVVGIRGNVATRMAKLQAGEADATFLAAAGLARLGEDSIGTRLDPEEWLPAPAQAAIGIECRANDEGAKELLSAINHRPSAEEVLAERALLEGLGGTCHSPIAALTRRDGDRLHMTAAIYSPDGAIRIAREATFAPGDCDAARNLARELLAEAPEHVAAHFGGVA